jgi:hypothetical protein
MRTMIVKEFREIVDEIYPNLIGDLFKASNALAPYVSRYKQEHEAVQNAIYVIAIATGLSQEEFSAALDKVTVKGENHEHC